MDVNWYERYIAATLLAATRGGRESRAYWHGYARRLLASAKAAEKASVEAEEEALNGRY